MVYVKKEKPIVENQAPSEEVVSIKKDKLNAILERLERLEFAANKSYLSHFDAKSQGEKKLKIVRLRTIDGKVILRWSDMLSNNVEKNEHGVWGEDQSVKLEFEDGTFLEMPYVFFARRYKLLPSEVISESTNNYGEVTFELHTDDNKTYKINSKFVN